MVILIHILNNIIEDLVCNSNQLWLLSQDMSKAYDLVNFELFQRSLHRIKMPPHSLIFFQPSIRLNKLSYHQPWLTNFTLSKMESTKGKQSHPCSGESIITPNYSYCHLFLR